MQTLTKIAIVLAFVILIIFTTEVGVAYPDARTRCLAPYQPVTLSSIGGGFESYTTSNGDYLLWEIGTEYIYVGWNSQRVSCKHNPGWHAGAIALFIPMTSDCAYFEIDNLDGGWSIVTDLDGQAIILHYGEPLVVDPYGVADIERYRAVETVCPE